jgi:protein PET117
MSLASKITFAIACGASVGTIFYVHFKQNSDRQKLHEGVLKDIERQRMQKIKNLYDLEHQKDLTKILRKEQDELDAIRDKV